MTEVFTTMLRRNADDSLENCRERRRRRLELRRRLSSIPTPRSLSLPAQMDNSISTSPEVNPLRNSESDDLIAAGTAESETPTVQLCPEYGVMSIPGRMRVMEDAIDVKTDLCRPEINHGKPVHFFAVFDGHGGAHVAVACRDLLHVFVKEELMAVKLADLKDGGAEDGWRKALERSFKRMDEVAMNICACGSVGHQCGCHSREIGMCGSTAVVALVTETHILVANCGDSRAVLCTDGKSEPLSFDHKPDRPDEHARVYAAGGEVVYLNGARVGGLLAMSRAFGDKYLKPGVTSEPEITFTKREPVDECLILASDGLWDVILNDTACEVALECLKDGLNGTVVGSALGRDVRFEVGEGSRGPSPTRSAVAATLLTRLALGRRSDDNISVIVVDLKRTSVVG